MVLNELIFSKAISKRVLRHSFFWIGWLFLTTLTCLNAIRHVEEKGVISIVQGHALIAVDQTLSMIPFCYFITYFLIPRFFVSGDYRLGLVILVISILGEFCLGFLLLGFFYPYINPFLGVGPLTTVVRAELIIKMIIAIN